MRLFLLLTLLIASSPAWASVIHLKDGRIIEGTITSKNKNSIEVNVDGATMTYFNDEIGTVDGQPVAMPAVAKKAIEMENEQATAAKVMPSTIAPVVVTADAVKKADAVGTDKRALILKFIEVFGTKAALEENFDLMLQEMSAEQADQAAKLKERVKISEIVDALIPIYDRNFTAEELQTYINFYQSPQGKKLLKTIPVLMRESIDVSAKYMESKFPEVNEGK